MSIHKKALGFYPGGGGVADAEGSVDPGFAVNVPLGQVQIGVVSLARCRLFFVLGGVCVAFVFSRCFRC